ncbi:MAG: hypothetical protein ACHQHM_01725 [Thermoanaerobaculales bacterium]
MNPAAARTLFDTAALPKPDWPERTLPAPPGWPEPPGPAAYHGLAGEIVGAIAPHTEADPVAILSQLLIAFGAAVGRGAHFQIEASSHHPNEFLVLVGDTAKARKGSSWDNVARLLEHADATLTGRILTGLSSGEGLIWAVRDPAGSDPGPPDRRLLVLEPEFASVLKQTSRDISTLSPVLRSAWDGRPLALLTRAAPARASAAHISVIGHITAAELRHRAGALELANGFLNRFMIIACRRVRLLPEGGHADPLADSPLARRLAGNLKTAQHAGQLRLHPEARALWWDAYAKLSEPTHGLAGALCARAEAHTIRLALIYALIDGEHSITPTHLHSALALWDYAAASATWALGQASGDPLAEQIHTALLNSQAGLTRTQLRDLFQRNRSGAQVEQALAVLAHNDRAHCEQIHTAGRPAELWHAHHPSQAPEPRGVAPMRNP